MKKQRRSRTIFGTIIRPLLALLLLESVLLIGVFGFGGTINQLKRNEESILGNQLENDKSYLEYFMVNRWSGLSRLSDTVNSIVQQQLESGNLTLQELQTNSDACHQVLQYCYADFIDELYSKQVNGVFVMFNTQDLTKMFDETSMPGRTGLMIRDLDPSSVSSSRNSDLLLMRAPVAAVRGLNIATSPAWRPLWVFSQEEDPANYDFLYQPFQAAYMAGSVDDAADYGFWAPGTSKLIDSTDGSVTYSMPLILEDGTVYGVIGVELMKDYFYNYLLSATLDSYDTSAYILAHVSHEGNVLNFHSGLISSDTLKWEDILSADWVRSEHQSDGYTTQINAIPYYLAAKQFNIYSHNTPFESQTWMLLCAVEEQALYYVANQAEIILYIAVILFVLVGLFGSYSISLRLSRPIHRLSGEVTETSQINDGIPNLSSTGIKEIDQFSTAITQLTQRAINASTRVMNILNMTSMELAGFEVRVGEKLFVTENFFPMFGFNVEHSSDLSDDEFKALLRKINTELPHNKSLDGSTVYEIRNGSGEVRYVRLCFVTLDNGMAAVAEDITVSTMERKRVEHERDYDMLTGLFNRRAFLREVELMLQDPDFRGHAAVIMMDLDNLKHYNDNFGHKWGDEYIQQAARSICSSLSSSNSIVARLSGDEFAIFLHGYNSHEEVRNAVNQLTELGKINNCFIGPNGSEHRISYTGGIAWYPQDSKDFHELMKFADFAMYEMKKTNKGQLNEFNFGSYNQESYLMQSRRELNELIKTEALQYHFQPIFCASDGKVFGYEALMRVGMPTLRTPDAVLNLARNENKLHDIERLTMMKSVEFYRALLDEQKVAPDAYLFINSIADHYLSVKEQTELKDLAGELVPKIILEITENAAIDPNSMRIKRNMDCYSGMLALDDYGSGYNGNVTLLELAPQYVKLDASLARGIDCNPDKQDIVSGLIEYAHQRNMMVVSEGIETAAELRKCVELGVDLLQGYFLARPAAIPQGLSADAMQAIQDENHK